MLKDKLHNNHKKIQKTLYSPKTPKVWGPIPSPPQNWTWELLMDEALYEAKKGALNGEVPVGAIIVHTNGTIISRGYNSPIKLSDPTAHAEIITIRSAAAQQNSYRLTDCIMVVTLEPCLMCIGAIVHARLKGIVYGALEMNTGAITSCIHGLDLHFHNYKPWHLGGIQGQLCAEVLKNFFAQLRSHKMNIAKYI